MRPHADLRRRAALLAALLLAVLVPAAPASASSATIYTGFVNTGTIPCTAPKADLTGLLNDASLEEYADPLTLRAARLKARQILAHGCQATAAAAAAQPTRHKGSSGGTPGLGTLAAVAALIAGTAAAGLALRRMIASRR
jgi:hypothetical protein